MVFTQRAKLVLLATHRRTSCRERLTHGSSEATRRVGERTQREKNKVDVSSTILLEVCPLCLLIVHALGVLFQSKGCHKCCF